MLQHISWGGEGGKPAFATAFPGLASAYGKAHHALGSHKAQGDGAQEAGALIVCLAAPQSALEQANAQRLAQPSVCILAGQDVLILQDTPGL